LVQIAFIISLCLPLRIDYGVSLYNACKKHLDGKCVDSAKCARRAEKYYSEIDRAKWKTVLNR